LQRKAAAAADRVRQVTPDQARSGLESAASSVKERPIPYTLGATFVLGLLIGRRTRGSR
jgi:hypothetical protein